MNLDRSLKIAFSALLISAVAKAQAPAYSPDAHFYKSDVSTGFNIGMSLYEIKNAEMQVMVKTVVDEVNLMSDDEVNAYAAQNELSAGTGGIRLKVKTHKIEALVEARNINLIEKMNNEQLPALTPIQSKTRTAMITDDQLIDTSISINYSPATDAHPELKKQYDPKGNFGLCFLRAHYYANAAGRRGLVKESIKKVFVVGTMMPLGFIPVGVWQFHVAATVRGEGGVWKVLDNHLSEYQEKAFTVTEWYKHYDKWLDSSAKYKVTNANGVEEELEIKSLFLFFTDPAKIGASSNAYNKEAFYGVDTDGNGVLEGKEKFYNGVFMDVDNLLQKSQPSVCDPDRYQPLPMTDARCSSPANQKRIAQRASIINQWKQTWKRAICLKTQPADYCY